MCEEKMKEKIYGYFTKSDEAGMYDVTVVMPSDMAEFFCVDREWDMVLESSLDLKEAAIETIEEQASGDTEGELYDSFCSYLEDEGNWDGNIEEGEVLEGAEAAAWFLNSGRLRKQN